MAKKTVQRTPIIIEKDDLPVIWVDEISAEAAKEFGQELLKFESDPDTQEIFVYIISYGGEVLPLLSMVDMMRGCEKPVHTVCSGMALSSGGLLLMAGNGTRWMAKNSYLLIHHVRTVSPMTTVEDTPTQEQDLKHTKHIEDRLISIIAERCTLTPKGIKAKMKEENGEWQLTAKEALKLGFIDKIGLPRIRKHLVTEYE